MKPATNKKEKTLQDTRHKKSTKTPHEQNMKDSSEYKRGAHDVVGEDARRSRDKAKERNTEV